MKNRAGFTLIEVMIAIGVLSLVMGAIFLLSTSTRDAALAQEAKLNAQDQVRNAMMQVVRELRQSASASINWNDLPGPAISYRVPMDIDGNGVPVDSAGNLELSPIRTISRDTQDLNNDGVTDTQLVLAHDGDFARVLGNQLLIDRDVTGDGQLERGLWFERSGAGVRVTIRAEIPAGPDGLRMLSQLQETVFPRN